jgi:hypothetical protein
MCKDAVNKDSTCQSIFRRLCTAKKIENFSFPVNRPDNVSSRPDAHLSTVPSVRMTCSSRPDARQTSIIRPDDVSFPSGPYTVLRSFCSSLHPSGHLSSPSGRISVLEQSQILSKFQKREDRSTVRTMQYPVQTRVSLRQESQIQISPSGRQSALVRTRAYQLRKLPIRLQPSRRLPILVWMHA